MSNATRVPIRSKQRSTKSWSQSLLRVGCDRREMNPPNIPAKPATNQTKQLQEALPNCAGLSSKVCHHLRSLSGSAITVSLHTIMCGFQTERVRVHWASMGPIALVAVTHLFPQQFIVCVCVRQALGNNLQQWPACFAVQAHILERQKDKLCLFVWSRGVDKVVGWTSPDSHWPDEGVVLAELNHLPSYPASMWLTLFSHRRHKCSVVSRCPVVLLWGGWRC